MGIFKSSRKSKTTSDSEDTSRSQSPLDSKEIDTFENAINQSPSISTSTNTNTFLTTTELQIQSMGYNTNQALSGHKTFENISIHSIESGIPGSEKYTSIRTKRNSNSCALIRSSDPDQMALISTIYRWGPGRRPRMNIFGLESKVSVEQAIDGEEGVSGGEVINVQSKSVLSRAQVFETSFGRFEWRYGSKEERRSVDADSLLILEKVDGTTRAKKGDRVAMLVRNDEFRTPGSVRYSGGNGGRLIMDLRMWEDNKKVHGGGSGEGVEAFVVASCILMLKREADRFVDNNIAAVT